MVLDVTGRIGGWPRRMVALLGVTTLVLVAGPPGMLSAAAGGTHLKPPQDVEVSITDDTFTLRWASGSDPGRNVTFSADYQTLTTNNWMKLPGCQYIASTNCDFSSLNININVYDEIKLRIRAEEGNSVSPWQELDPFVPQHKAQIGPPKVHLEAEDKAIIIHISPPGGKDSLMWAMDKSRFNYSIVFWKSASDVRTFNTMHSRYRVSPLSPETAYCVKAKARLWLQRRSSVESPMHCVNTTENTDQLPTPENLQVSGEGQVYILQWNYTHENVTFQAQWLHAYLKKTENFEAKWAPLRTCEHIRTSWCTFPRSAFLSGIYFLRVRASRGNRMSPWSQEKEFDTDSQASVPTPVLILKAVNSSSLRVFVGTQSKSAYQRYLTTYEIIFWENTSNVEKTLTEERADFVIPNLKALTVYCVKARALLHTHKWSSRSALSDTVCQRTQPGDSPSVWLTVVSCTVLAVSITLCALQGLRRLVDYVFFPSRAPPSAINEYITEQSLKNILLSTSEEQTEKCFIIENMDTVALVEETHRTGEGHKTYNSQTSEDSGNYSNEDENSSSRASDDLGQEASVWRE
ncbi:interferon alpha/beta receptor 1 isoform X2 [Sturnira hondurensis]|uniref:interferon alpha/beta receptor 1 isoform X2 n=1 Tax=Sturnira hondurensis TaxID=192404 RepID=UPI001879E715|nr:interferon alpha/beta receptor 1 isoform X2 [Sturnira hondurensis]